MNNEEKERFRKHMDEFSREQLSVLDTIRAEIEQEPYVSKMEVLEIIDKYRAESEVKHE